jgi:replicative DNA helicase
MIENIASIVFDPPTISTRAVHTIQNNKTEAPSYTLGVPALNDYVMHRKNKVNGLLADTSQCKTTFMSHLARHTATQLNTEAGDVGIFFTWEDTIEDFGMSDIAFYSKIPLASLYHGDVKEYEFKRLLKASVERASTPLWIVGQSEALTKAQPRMTMTDVFAAVDYVQNVQKRNVKFVMLDYLQRISRDDINEKDTRMKYSGVMDKVKDLALAYHPSTWIGSQVGRDKVEKLKWRQPQIHWAMETANFEHTCDGALSLWLVHKSKDVWHEGDCLQEKQGVDGEAIFVRKETLIAEILKQKKAETGQVRAMDFVPEFNMFVPYNTAGQVRQEIIIETLGEQLLAEESNV